MKKIAAIFSFILALSLNASAQDHKPTSTESAKKDAVALTEYLGLTAEEQTNFIALFDHKYRVLQDSTVPEPRKAEMRLSVNAKINASLTPEQREKLSKNPELLERLLN